MSWFVAALPTDPLFYLVGLMTAFVMSVGKGAFGGGLAILGIPMLALVTDPITAAIVTAILVAAMDWIALGTFPRDSFSKPDLKWLLPGLLVGLGFGLLVFETVDRRLVALLVAVIALAFTAHYVLGKLSKAPARAPLDVRPGFGLAAGVATGFTTFVAHAGGPPMALYLMRRGLTKTAYAATAVVVFTLGNLVKLPGYLYAGLDEPQAYVKALVLLPAVPLGVWVGRRILDTLPRDTIFNACYGLVGLGSLKLLWDSLRGFGLL